MKGSFSTEGFQQDKSKVQILLLASQLLPDSEKALTCEVSIFDSKSNWEGGILLLRISNAASGGTYCTGFLTQCMALIGCQGFDVVSAFRVFLINQAKKKKKKASCLSVFPNLNNRG